MHKGGRPTPQQAGLTLVHRENLWTRLAATEEGSLFQLADLVHDMEADALPDLEAMVGYDLVAVHKGWYTAVREGRYVRMLPNPEKVAHAWCAIHDWGIPTLFGDWWAHRNGLYPWEPIAGYRFRVPAPGANTTLSLGHMRLRIVSCPTWLAGDAPHIQLARALCDMPHKTLFHDLRTWLAGGEAGQRRTWLVDACSHLAGVEDEAWDRTPMDARGWKPSEVARSVTAAAL